MKLVKLSLASIVAAGALANLASAVSLEEAIKNVDVTGYARYRYDSKNIKDPEGQRTGNNTDSTHRFTSDIDFKAAIDDRFFGVIGFRYDSVDNSGDRANARTMVGQDDNGYDEFGQTFNVRQFYLGYTAGNTTLMAGRQVLGTFFTDDMVGTGIKLLNSDISGLTLAGMAFDNLQNDENIGLGSFIFRPSGVNHYANIYDKNLYGVAAIGSYDPVSFQLWYAALDSVAQLYAADVTVGLNFGDVDVSLQAQAAASSMWANTIYDGESDKDHRLDDATFLAVELGAKAFGFDGSVGYVNLYTHGDGISLISFEDQGGFITAGEDLLDYTKFAYDANIYFITAGYTFDKVRVGADYVGIRVDGEIINGKALNADAYEAVARVDYKYSKKLNFKAWYSYIDADQYNKNKKDTKHLRFEARYNF